VYLKLSVPKKLEFGVYTIWPLKMLAVPFAEVSTLVIVSWLLPELLVSFTSTSKVTAVPTDVVAESPVAIGGTLGSTVTVAVAVSEPPLLSVIV